MFCALCYIHFITNSTHMQDLQEVTQEVHYENFRAEKLAGGGSVPRKTRSVYRMGQAICLVSYFATVVSGMLDLFELLLCHHTDYHLLEGSKTYWKKQWKYHIFQSAVVTIYIYEICPNIRTRKWFSNLINSLFWKNWIGTNTLD